MVKTKRVRDKEGVRRWESVKEQKEEAGCYRQRRSRKEAADPESSQTEIKLQAAASWRNEKGA